MGIAGQANRERRVSTRADQGIEPEQGRVWGHGPALLSTEANDRCGSRPCEKTITPTIEQFTVVAVWWGIAKTSDALTEEQ
jgi:hypothetical protein